LNLVISVSTGYFKSILYLWDKDLYNNDDSITELSVTLGLINEFVYKVILIGYFKFEFLFYIIL
jgi:hypothetical protein